MPVDESLRGRTFPPTEPYTVSRERILEFARATGSTYDEKAAPATFPIVVAFAAMTALMQDPTVGIALHRVVHGEQRFTYTRPVVAGDELRAALEVKSVKSLGGNSMINAETVLTDAAGEQVVTASATLVVRATPSESE